MNDPQKKAFGQYIKALRQERKLSFRRLQELSGVSNAYLSQIETGKRNIPSPEILKKLCEPLGVPYDEMMEKAGHISSKVRSELLPETIATLESQNGISELLSSAAEIFINSVTNLKGVLKDEHKEFLIKEIEALYPEMNPKDIKMIFNNPNILHRIFEELTIEEKISFLNNMIQDFVGRDINPLEVFKEDTNTTYKFSVLKVPVLGSIAAGSPIFADEHIEEWTEIPNMWSLREKDVFILKVKGDSMIGSRIFEGDKVVVKIQPEVENGEIAVVNVNGEEATLKRVKKTENGQVILYPDNPKYDPTFITNENARIVGKVIQVMFEP